MTNPYSNNTLPAARITLSVTGRLRQFLIVTASVFLLSACDGGIFGTGDGEDPKLDLETVDGDQNSGFSGVNEPPNIEDYEINDLNVAPPDDDDVPFGNNTQTDVDNRTLVRIVNAITDSTDSLVMIDRQDTESPLVAKRYRSHTAEKLCGDRQQSVLSAGNPRCTGICPDRRDGRSS